MRERDSHRGIRPGCGRELVFGLTLLPALIAVILWDGQALEAFVEEAPAPGRCCLALLGDTIRIDSGEPCDWFLVRAIPGAYDDTGSGRFHGADTLLYSTAFLQGGTGTLVFVAGEDSGLPSAGTFYIAAARPGIAMPDTIASREPLHAVCPSIAQVAVRSGDTYIDYLLETIGTPFIMAPTSTPGGSHQADDRMGFDCAGLAVYGIRRMGMDVGYLGPAGILPFLEPVLDGLLAPREIDGTVLYLDDSGATVPTGDEGLRPGDILHFRVQVSVFLEDAGTPGLLDPQDLVIQSWFDGPMICTLEENGFYGLPLRVLRWGQATPASTVVLP